MRTDKPTETYACAFCGKDFDIRTPHHCAARPNSAFPHPGTNRIEASVGLTKREHFAAMAMQGLCGANDCAGWTQDEIAVSAVQIADALLAELAKEPAP